MTLQYSRGQRDAGFEAMGIEKVVASLTTKAGTATFNGTEVHYTYYCASGPMLEKAAWLQRQGIRVYGKKLECQRIHTRDNKRHG